LLCFAVTEARKRTQLPCNFTVKFYGGKYFPSFGSIFPVEDIVKLIPREQVRAEGKFMQLGTRLSCSAVLW
jgi:hypothetical protein